REAGLRDEIQPLALRRFVRRLGATAEERHLRPGVHRETAGTTTGTFSASTTAACAEAAASARLAGLWSAVIDRRVLVDLLVEHVGSEPVRPFPIPRLMTQIHRADVAVRVDLADDSFAERLGRVAVIRVPRIAQRADRRVPAARREIRSKAG